MNSVEVAGGEAVGLLGQKSGERRIKQKDQIRTAEERNS